MRVRFAAEAEAEIDEAADWYAVHGGDVDDLDDRFLAEVERVARLVGERPRAFTEIEPGIRRAVLRRFPYGLVYVVKPSEILVLAVAHHGRRPGYWRGRG
jgi:plasmid stabilization system protein ParE